MKILCYGDSNTWGHNPKDANRFDEETRWTKKLAKKLGNEYEIIEEGLCGRSASYYDSVIPYRHGLSTLRMVLDTYQPIDLIIIMLGTNDLKACNCPDAVSISKGIREMIKEIKNPFLWNVHMSVPKILIVSPIYIKDELDNNQRSKIQFTQKAVDISHMLASEYQALCKAYDCYFMDASKYAEASSIDCIHMDAINHAKLADAMYEKILEIK